MKQVTITTYEGDQKRIDVWPPSVAANPGEEIEFLATHEGDGPPKLTLHFPCAENEEFICQNGEKKLSLNLEAGVNPSQTVEVCAGAGTGDRAYDVVSDTGGRSDPIVKVVEKAKKEK
jgi:hypothetical protein